VSEVGSTKTGNSAVDAFRDDNGSSRAACANGDTKKGGDPEGGIRIALGAAGKSCFESWRAGGYAARTDFPRSLAIAWRSI
jgi:hypothetical protein